MGFFLKSVYAGDPMIHRRYGLAWHEPHHHRIVLAPVPLNVVIRLAWLAWGWCMRGGPSRCSDRERRESHRSFLELDRDFLEKRVNCLTATLAVQKAAARRRIRALAAIAVAARRLDDQRVWVISDAALDLIEPAETRELVRALLNEGPTIKRVIPFLEGRTCPDPSLTRLEEMRQEVDKRCGIPEAVLKALEKRPDSASVSH